MRAPGLREGGRRRLAAALAAAAWLLTAGCDAGGPREPGAPAPAAVESDPAPDFALPDLRGGTQRLSELRGRVVVIDFWATWCPPCEFQVPELNKLHAAHQERGDVVVLGVSVDYDGEEVVQPWVEEHGVDYPVLLADPELAQEFGAPGFPFLAIVAPDGEVAHRHSGVLDYEELEELVSALVPARAT